MTLKSDLLLDQREASKFKSAWPECRKSSCRRASMPTHLEADKESSDEESGVVNAMGKRMKNRNRKLFFPLSSPIKCRENQRQVKARKEKRQDVALGRRGGLNSMGEFVMQHELEAERTKLNEQARLHSFDVEEYFQEDDYYDFDQVYKNIDPSSSQPKEATPHAEERDFIEQQKAEEMMRAEEIEIEYLTANLTL